jgi:hypothetical protein
MITTGILRMDGFAEREVIEMTYSLDRDNKERVTGGGQIVLKVKPLKNGNSELFYWMYDEKLVIKGSVLFMAMDNYRVKSIDFDVAYCIGFTEHWRKEENELPHWEQITLSCKEITVC